MFPQSHIAIVLISAVPCAAWLPSPSQLRMTRNYAFQLDAAVGIFFGTSTGSTQTVADIIFEAFGADVASEPVDGDTLDKEALAQIFGSHDSLVVGTPTWNTGADVERSGTGWDELYYDTLAELKSVLEGKTVAVFGLGDQVSYAENYADATGELFDVFEGLGCRMIGSCSQEGYEHEDSKSIRGDQFCGLLLDMVNQEELTEERVAKWVEQLKVEGILDGAASAATSTPDMHVPSTSTDEIQVNGAPVTQTVSYEERIQELERENDSLRKRLQLLPLEGLESINEIHDQTFESHDDGGFTPHRNSVTGKTMWTSPDGRKSYVIMHMSPVRNM